MELRFSVSLENVADIPVSKQIQGEKFVYWGCAEVPPFSAAFIPDHMVNHKRTLLIKVMTGIYLYVM